MAGIGRSDRGRSLIKRIPSSRAERIWLLKHQQADGGWGESAEATTIPGCEVAGQPPPFPNRVRALPGTACRRPASSSGRRGGGRVPLEKAQAVDGTWSEPEFTGTGFPRVFYLRYHMYPIYFPLLALAAFPCEGAMSVPWTQMWTVARYVLENRLRGRRRFPLVLMLEPLFRCNLACRRFGKIQHPAEILAVDAGTVWAAADKCGTPLVSIPGGEPLLHPQIDEIVAGLVDRRKYVYLCTNALRLVEMLPRFRPSRYLAFSIHLDGIPRRTRPIGLPRRGLRHAAVAALRVAHQSSAFG